MSIHNDPRHYGITVLLPHEQPSKGWGHEIGAAIGLIVFILAVPFILTAALEMQQHMSASACALTVHSINCGE